MMLKSPGSLQNACYAKWNNGILPPCDEISNDWENAVVDLQKNPQFGHLRHDVVSRQAAKVGR